MNNAPAMSDEKFCLYKYRSQKASKIKIALVVYISFVFIQSLFYKFADAPETQYIFATLDAWAAGFAIPGLFQPGGIFSAKVIGSAELVASSVMLASLITGLVYLRVAGALLSIAIISGAIFFHLFTPLGVEVLEDGGLLFAMACGVWLSAVSLLFMERDFIKKILGK
ncbi:MAG: hypothetical protein K2Q12_11475 [Rickettsiales bacterium]|nr:hypothetical protein [Rickettsiales bacterium]